MLLMILEAAFRSLLMALAVLAGMRLLRVQAVLAQKVAWVLVLLAAAAMPLVMRAPWLALDAALRIPVRPLSSVSRPVPQAQAAALQVSANSRLAGPILVRGSAPNRSQEHVIRIPKPSAAHALGGQVEHDSVSAELVESVTVSASVQPKSAAMPTQAKAGFAHGWAPNWVQIKLAILVLYFAVLGVLLARTLAGLAIAWRIWRRSEPVAEFLGDKNALMRVRVSPDLSTPVTIGSSIVLPADWREWDAAKLRIVLAHEHSHVRQGDFYLQLMAALHLAVFWFSPLGWWLQRKISELGEALSDRAGLEQATDPASYAQILLEFAAMPRSYPFAGALTGVAMARSSNLSSRIERVLNARLFRLAFLGSRRHAFLAAVLVPVALVAVVACIRIVPAVEAAQAITGEPITGQVNGKITGQVNGEVNGQINGQFASQVLAAGQDPLTRVSTDGFTGELTGPMLEELTSIEIGQSNTPLAPRPPQSGAPAAPPLPSPPAEGVEAPQAPEAVEMEAPEPPPPPGMNHGFAFGYSDGDDGDDSWAIVSGKNNNVTMSGHHGKELEKARQKYHSNFIWFVRDGKSYVITDPAIVAKAQSYFKGNEVLESRQAELDKLQAKLDREMATLQPEVDKARLPGPEFEAQMAKLQSQLAYLQSDEYKKLAESISKQVTDSKKLLDEAALEAAQEKLGNLQEKIGDIQGQIGEIQGKIGEREGLMGEKQGEIGERMGKLGEEMGKIGEQQGKIAEEAGRKLKSVFDQAVKDGTAKPVE
jgi:beta-lactamase regulating signal transducer with metallopeptidase domain